MYVGRMGFVMDGQTLEGSKTRIERGGGVRNGENDIGFGIEAEYQQYYPGNDDNEDEYEDNNDEYEENNENIENDGLLNEDSTVPLMPDEFYSDVDVFLNRPPPKFKGILQNKSKTREKLEEKIIKSSSLPVLLPPKPKKIESKINTGKKGPGKKVERYIDPNLLQQAFEYTEMLARESYEQEIQQQRQQQYNEKKKSNSAPHDSVTRSRNLMANHRHQNDDNDDDNENDDDYDDDELDEIQSCDRKQIKLKNAYGSGKGGGHTRTKGNGSQSKSKNKKGNGMVKRLRSQTYTHQDQLTGNQSSSFDTSMTHGDGGSNRQVLDFNALVANFEQGITLKQLKQELEESRASEARSRKAVQDISKEMSSKMRF